MGRIQIVIIGTCILMLMPACMKRTSPSDSDDSNLTIFGRAALGYSQEFKGVGGLTVAEIYHGLAGKNPRGISFIDYSDVRVSLVGQRLFYEGDEFELAFGNECVYIIRFATQTGGREQRDAVVIKVEK